MRAGDLDRRLTLLRWVVTDTNDFGEEQGVWAQLATVWASRRDISDAERQRAAQLGATVSTRYQVRYSDVLAALNPKDRAQEGDRLCSIVAVKEIGRREGLEITVTAMAEDGVP